MTGLRGALLLLLSAFLAASPCSCWTQDELDLFDLVEEIGLEQDFYSLLQIEKDATSAEVRRAYRQLSLQLHPDKSEDPNAAENFRKMVAVADVLRDDVKREMYDQVLIEGLPDWKQPLFYYRRMRKMGLMELGILLLLMASVAHYLYGWAVFAEKQIVLQDVLTRKQKKEQRKSKRGTKTIQSHLKLEAEVEMLTTQAQASIPHLKDLLPVILAKSLIRLLLLCWSLLNQKLEGVATAPPTSQPEESVEEEEKMKERRPRKKAKSTWFSSNVRNDGPEEGVEDRAGWEVEEEVGWEEEEGEEEGDKEGEEGEKEKEGEGEGRKLSQKNVGHFKTESSASNGSGVSAVREDRAGADFIFTHSATAGKAQRPGLVSHHVGAEGSLVSNSAAELFAGNSTLQHIGQGTSNNAADVASADEKTATGQAGGFTERAHNKTMEVGQLVPTNGRDSRRRGRGESKLKQMRKESGASAAEVKPRKEKGSHPEWRESSTNSVENRANVAQRKSGSSQNMLSSSKTRQVKMQSCQDGPHTNSTVLPLGGISETLGSSASRYIDDISLKGDDRNSPRGDATPLDGQNSAKISSNGHPVSLSADARTSSSFLGDGPWSQYQQKQLEWALTKYPKFSAERWLNVAKAVPGKTQDECIERCRQLHAEVKRKRTAQAHA